MLGVDRAMAACAGGEEEFLVLAVHEQAHRDALFRQGARTGDCQVAADRHLALRRGPKDGVHLAFDDAARIHLHEYFRLVARLHIAQFVLVEEGQHPGIILLDEAHHRHGGELRGAHAGTQREIRHAAIGRREMRGAFEVVFRTAGGPLRTWRSALWPADSVASAARNSLSRLPRSLCACSRSARFPAPVAASAVNCSTRFFARSIRGVSEAFLAVGVIELILQLRCSVASAASRAASNGTGSILKSTSPFLIGRFGSIGTSVTCPVTRGTIGMT